MLGRGVKRKWSCLEEELEDLPAAPCVTEGKPHLNVSDGSSPPEGPVVAPSKSQQRQVVLGLCLEKLQTGVELSLRRSVLLINTLRQLQEEMRSDGEDVCSHRESCLLRDSMKEDMAVTCPDCTEEDDIDSLLLPELSNQEEASLNDPKTFTAFSDAVSAMGYLSDLALDDIFEDIDTSMYESSDLSSAWASGVGLWDEDVKVKQQGALQSCISDLNELDHIMEILVKS
ncbi:hypothetical protein NQD34_016008 [Periophthalmus magnuspinnatus]|uniref:uncharacterized protein si:dkey-177p2.6 n=1 Tax=Periophthalmus magnuspinnatus TaxID=409849 RepID=UPI00145B8B13|nr:uncharacterized protein si:dkey-177p2.6 [Periophthalmus magnuspinnatus]KAJ0008593.1 hypothetical protein NQD34_016008 [Periophthalmus magnuspinnatus]